MPKIPLHFHTALVDQLTAGMRESCAAIERMRVELHTGEPTPPPASTEWTTAEGQWPFGDDDDA